MKKMMIKRKKPIIKYNGMVSDLKAYLVSILTVFENIENNIIIFSENCYCSLVLVFCHVFIMFFKIKKKNC